VNQVLPGFVIRAMAAWYHGSVLVILLLVGGKWNRITYGLKRMNERTENWLDYGFHQVQMLGMKDFPHCDTI
jgi:hypothetical protein